MVTSAREYNRLFCAPNDMPHEVHECAQLLIRANSKQIVLQRRRNLRFRIQANQLISVWVSPQRLTPTYQATNLGGVQPSLREICQHTRHSRREEKGLPSVRHQFKNLTNLGGKPLFPNVRSPHMNATQNL